MPKVDFIMVMRLASSENHREASSISNALSIIITQVKQNAKVEYVNPLAAVETGKASIPAPIQVPATIIATPNVLLCSELVKQLPLILLMVYIYRW